MRIDRPLGPMRRTSNRPQSMARRTVFCEQLSSLAISVTVKVGRLLIGLGWVIVAVLRLRDRTRTQSFLCRLTRQKARKRPQRF